MRVDADAVPTGIELDPRARLRHYVGAFRRRWFLVAVPLLLGAMLGWFTAPQPESSKGGKATPTTVAPSPYYKATHVLIQDNQTGSDGNSSSQPVNLAQTAYLVSTGEIPARVAQALGLSPDDVESRLVAVPRSEVSSIEIQAVGDDPAQAVQIADTAAADLLATLKSQNETTAAAQRDAILAQIDQISQELSTLNAKIAANPPDRTELEAQQRSLSNQYSVVFQQLTDLANSPPPSAGLSTLSKAKARAITANEYRTVLQTIRDGAVFGTTTTTTTAPEELEKVKSPGKPAGAGTRAVVGGVAGLMLGVGLVLLLDRFDGRLRRREDVEAATGVVVVAEIPPLPRKEARSTHLQAFESPRSRSAEAYRVVRGAAVYALSSMSPPAQVNGTPHPAAVLMVTSAQPGEGKTVTASNLATVFAEGGLRVLVVNCDFRRPRIHKYLLEEDPPTTAVAHPPVFSGGSAPTNGTAPKPDPGQARPTRIPGVDLITGIGEHDPDVNPLEVLALQNRIIEARRGDYDVIILDTAPFLTTNDASELLRHTDLVLVVVRSGKTTAEAAHRLAEVLQRFSAPVLGVVFNASDEYRGAQYYYYGYTEPPGPRDQPDSDQTPPHQTSPGQNSTRQTDAGQTPPAPARPATAPTSTAPPQHVTPEHLPAEQVAPGHLPPGQRPPLHTGASEN